MKKILYAKFNKTRNPKFQTGTKIVLIDGKKYIEKSALTEEAKEHIRKYQHRFALNQRLYNNIVPLEGIFKDGIMSFPFIEGQSAAKLLENKKKDVTELCAVLLNYIDKILSYRDDVLCEFECTQEFIQIFGEANDFCGKAVKGADIDIIFDNIINCDNQWYSIDYEWTFDFPIPVEFIKYRILFRYYYKERAFFYGKMTEEEFLEYFNISESMKLLFEKWELSFQYYVYGLECQYVYPAKYTKQIIDFRKLTRKYGNVEKALADREESLLTKQHELNLKENELQQTQMAIQSLTEQRNNYAEAYNQTIQSISWKLTKPVRYIGSGVNSVLRKSRTGILIGDGLRYFGNNGLRSTIKRIKELYGRKTTTIAQQDLELSDEEIAYERSVTFEYAPVISILVPLYNTPEKFLREMIESVVNQTYGNWQLCLADGSDEQHSDVAKICKEYIEKNDKIKYKKLEKNEGISVNTNECIDMADGEYIGLFDHDDVLHLGALFECMKVIDSERPDFIYTDELTFVDSLDNVINIHYKPDYSPDTLRSYNYICHFSVFSKQLLEKAGKFRKEFDGSQDYDLILRLTEKAEKIIHIPKILYFWRAHANSVAQDISAKPYTLDAAKKAIGEHLERLGLEGTIMDTRVPSVYKINYKIVGEPKISILIPNKDHIDELKTCITSVLEKSTYKNIEIIVIENNSESYDTFDYYHQLEEQYANVKVVYWKGEFNYAAINNFGFQNATGEYVLLLNNDIEVITPNWIEEMLMFAQRNDVGAVGAMLYYPDDTIQHAGVILGIGGVAGHSHKYFKRGEYGYASRLTLAQNLTAVTAACMLMRREVFEIVDGLDESYKVAFNDVDLCMRIRQQGYLIVFTPFAELYHYESKSRGLEDTAEKQMRFKGEIDQFMKRWGKELEKGDPYYNQNLTLVREDFSLKDKDEEVFRYF